MGAPPISALFLRKSLLYYRIYERIVPLAPTTDLPPRCLHLLIVEDEILLSMLLEDILVELGHEVLATCSTVKTAIAAIESQSFDGAILDLNLHGERADAVAEKLAARQIPFIIATGGSQNIDAQGALALVTKPYQFADIERAVENFLAS